MELDLKRLEAIYDDIEAYRKRKEKEAEKIIRKIFKQGMRISCMKYDNDGTLVRVTGIITHLGEGEEWFYARMLLDPKWWNVIRQNSAAPLNEVWLALSDPNEKILILEE